MSGSGLLSRTDELSVGVGTEQAPCSLAAINLAVTGVLSDERPPCMDRTIYFWVLAVQDNTPAHITRDNPRWRELLAAAPGTGSEALSGLRRRMVEDWMWSAVALVQPVADSHSLGDQWRSLVSNRSTNSFPQGTGVYVEKTVSLLCSLIEDVRSFLAYPEDPLMSEVLFAVDSVFSWTQGRGSWSALDPVGFLERLIYLEKD